MKSILASVGLMATAAQAAPALDTGGSLRLRSEHVSSGGGLEPSYATSLRATGFARWEPTAWASLLGEVEAVGSVGDFDDGEGLPQGQGVIPDPSVINLNRAFVELRPSSDGVVRVGRQRISLGEERFVGSVAFRQNDQVFDAIRGFTSLPFGGRLDVANVLGVNRPLGPRGQDRRLESESLLLRAEIPTPVGTVFGFRHDLDLGDDGEPTPVPGGQTLTYGAGLDGRLGTGQRTWTYGLSLAQQDNAATGETVPYARFSTGLTLGPLTVLSRYERLSRGAEGFQTPLGTNHAFQGLADLFLVTPSEGLEDLSLGLDWRAGDVGRLRGVVMKVRAHHFDPVTDGERFGREIDLTVRGRWRNLDLSVERGAYKARGFGEDTTRWWLTISKRL